MRTFPKVAAVVIASSGLVPARTALAQNDEAPAPVYARAGLLEVGGFAHFMVARDYSSLGFYPTFGWFAWDNLELSAIIGVTRVGQTLEGESGESADVSRTQLLFLGEPSFHVPFSENVYGFVGVGLGLAHEARTPGPGAGPGFAVAPRLGVNLIIARSGVLTPAVQASYQTTEALATQNGDELAGHSSLGFQAGYTVIW